MKALIQPVLDRREDWKQNLPTPIGIYRQDRFLYFGDAGEDISGLGKGCLLWNGGKFDVLESQAVFVGDEQVYWWAILTPGEDERT